MTIEFIEQRIREQEEYIYGTQVLNKMGIVSDERFSQIYPSAQGQLDYFWRKKTDWLAANGFMKFPVIKNFDERAALTEVEPIYPFLKQSIEMENKRAAYAQEFENIMKASTTIVH